MPMVARIASGSFTGLSGIAAGAVTRLITTATINPGFSGTNIANQAAMYAIFWSYFVTAGGSAGGSAQIPCFTWRDPDLNVGVTSTGGAIGGMYANGAVSATVWGASGSAGAGLTGVVSAHQRGFECFQAGSGASGASAYIQVSSLGTGGAFTRFDYQVFRIDDWAV